MTHAGHSYHESTVDGIAAVAEQELFSAIVTAAREDPHRRHPLPDRVRRPTPTAMHSRDFTGITEMRGGVYCFNDLDQEFIGACSTNDLALSVLAFDASATTRIATRC